VLAKTTIGKMAAAPYHHRFIPTVRVMLHGLVPIVRVILHMLLAW